MWFLHFHFIFFGKLFFDLISCLKPEIPSNEFLTEMIVNLFANSDSIFHQLLNSNSLIWFWRIKSHFNTISVE